MFKKNLFLVNTPFHLLTAFILSKGLFQQDTNYLALIHPHGYAKWSVDPLLSYMSSNASGYKAVFPLVDWMTSKNKKQSWRAQVAQVREEIGALGVDDIFLGSDIDVQNQLLVGALGKSYFYRYEDGLYSYYNENRRKPRSHRLFHQLKIYLMKKAAGIDGKVCINTSTAGDNHSGIGDYMYKPQLLRRFSPCAYEIDSVMIQTALGDLKRQGFLQPMMEQKSILYLSQPLVEKKLFTIEEELTLLKNMMEPLGEKICLWYKPHPNDSAYKIDFYRKNLPQLKIFDSIAPVELSFACEENLRAVVSYQSTALMYPDLFSPRRIRAISLAAFYKNPLHAAYAEIMRGAGVAFPAAMEETAACLKEAILQEGLLA